MSLLGWRRGVRDRPVVGGDVVLGADVRIESTPVASHVLALGDGRIRIGDRTRIGHGAAISSQAQVTIGSDVDIGSFVIIMDSDFHDAQDTAAAGRIEPVGVGDRVRIGHGVTLMPGSHVGDDAVIDAGSVVGGGIAPGVHVAGHPAAPALRGTSLPLNVPEVVRATFGLAAPPPGSALLAELEGADSLGMLRLLLEIERFEGVRLDEREFVACRTVDELARLISVADR